MNLKNFKDVDKLSKNDFEIFVGQVLSSCGWKNVEITKPGHEFKHGDGGVDIFCEKSGEKFAVECKHRKIENKCTVEDLNQLETGAKLAQIKNKILVTNTYFTSEVEYRAFRLGVELVDRGKLKDFYESKTTEIGKTIKPYPYQKNIVGQCIEQYRNKKDRLLIQLATGLGKTYTVAFIIKELIEKNKNLKVLFLAHQIEIVTQSATSFKNIFGIGTHTYSGCVGGFIPDEKTTFTFAVFDTLYSKMNRFSKNDFDIIVVDEAHHVPAATYRSVVEYFKPKLLIGLTATPFRTDRQDVLQFFGGPEGHIGKHDLYWALKHRWLAFPRYEVYMHDISQEKIDAIEKGFSIEDIDRNLFVKEKDEKMIEALEKKGKEIKNCKAIVFCRNIAHIKHLIKYFPPGKATYAYSGKMTGEERRKNIRDFREGSFQYILTCNLFNEGIDIPETNLLAFLRTTNSRLIWLQQLGRGLRKTKDKEFVDVFDFVGTADRVNEIKAFEKAFSEQKIDRPNLNEENISNIETSTNPKHYDTSIKVKWNFKGAAKVLKLLEKQEYDLALHQDTINALRAYYEKYNKIPKIEDLEKKLNNVSNDQLNTLFHSYFGYCVASLPYDFHKEEIIEYFKTELMNFLEKFYEENRIVPTYNTIKKNFIYKNLPLINKNFINYAFKPSIYPIKNFDNIFRKNIEASLKKKSNEEY